MWSLKEQQGHKAKLLWSFEKHAMVQLAVEDRVRTISIFHILADNSIIIL